MPFGRSSFDNECFIFLQIVFETAMCNLATQNEKNPQYLSGRKSACTTFTCLARLSRRFMFLPGSLSCWTSLEALPL